MPERTRHPAEERAEQELDAAIRVLDESIMWANMREAPPEIQETLDRIRDDLFKAFKDISETPPHSLDGVRQQVTQARDLWRDLYNKNKPRVEYPEDHAVRDHCENAIAAIREAERAHLIERVRARVTKDKEREDRQRGNDGGRERD